MKEKSPQIQRKSIRELVPDASPEAIDLMAKLFVWDPRKRLSAKEALKHEFIFKGQMLDYRITEDDSVHYYDFEFEKYNLPKEIIRQLILDDVILSNSQKARDLNE